MKKNDIVKLHIDSLSSDGSGVGRAESMVVFTPMSCAGDTLEAHILKVKKSYAFAKVHRILTPSPDRVEADCPVYAQCGGCAFRHMRYEAELAQKRKMVDDALAHIGGLDLKTEGILSLPPDRYRNKAQYPIFDANIREYLGAGRSVNKGIINTLESPTERSRFFFYNNGITIICSDLTVGGQTKQGRPLDLANPQIVNGCQTVSSIHQVLSAYPESELAEEFKDSFVMAKILIIPDDPDKKDFYDELRRSIVKYNNSQNSIDEKNFAANEAFFRTVQRELIVSEMLV